MTQKTRSEPDRKKQDRLSQAQALMFSHITRPLIQAESGCGAELNSIRDEEFNKAANELFKPSWSLSSIDRLEVYNRQYWYRVLDSMLDDFPGVQATIGAERFDSLVYAYLQEYPSVTYTLRGLGHKLAEFIEANAKFTNPDTELACQMAQFEWAAIEAFDKQRYPLLPPNALAASNPDSLVLKLQPYVSILESDYALDDFALALDKSNSEHDVSTAQASRCVEQTECLKPTKKHVYLVIHRLQNSVYYKRVNDEQFVLLNAISRGATLAEACEELAERLTAAKQKTLPDRLGKYFSEWMRLNWFADPTAID
jgi:hypothetical protein